MTATMLSIDVERRRVRSNPRDPEFFNDPYRAYSAIREASPVFFWEDYGFWCFARHADVSALLRDRRFGRQITHLMSRAELGWPEPKPHLQPFDALERHSILELEPPEHTRLRNLVNRAFVSRRIEKLGPRIAALAHERIDAFARHGSADLMAEFAGPIPVAVIADLLGVPREMGRELVDWSHRMVAMYQFGVDREVEERAAEAARAFADFVRSFARARRGDLGDDLISQLLIAESDGGRLSEDELVATVILLLNAGHEATVQAIGNGVKTMLDEERRCAPRVRGRKGDRRDSRRIVAVRPAAPPVHPLRAGRRRVRRRAASRRAKGSAFCSAPPIAIPSAFPIPTPSTDARAPNPHVSFGAGIHFCVGAPLARLELIGRAADPVRPPAGLAPRRAAALSRCVPFSWA